MFNVLSDPAVYEFENEPPPSAEWLTQRFAKLESRASADGTQEWLNWVIRLRSGELAGYVQATVFQSGATLVAYELASRHWRKGIGRSALSAVLDELSSNHGAVLFAAALKSANFRSEGLLVSLGFEPASDEQAAQFEAEADEKVMVKGAGTLAVEPLARHRRLLPLIEGWFVGEWPAWYGPTGPGNAAQDLAAFAASEAVLPVGFVAFSHGIPVGVGALKAESIPTHTHLEPWAAAGFVLPAYRGQDMGAAILAALVTHAQRLGFIQVYCGTSTAGSLLQRCGWSSLEVIQHAGKPLTIFRSAA